MTSPPEPDDTRITDLAVRLVLAMMRSASTDQIRPIDWWVRARTSLETAAAVAESWPQMVSKMGAKLQIQALGASSSASISEIGSEVGPAFDRFRLLCERDALFIVAMAQAERDLQRKETT